MKILDSKSTCASIFVCMCMHSCSGFSNGASRIFSSYRPSSSAAYSTTLPRLTDMEPADTFAGNAVIDLTDLTDSSLLPMYPAVSTQKLDGIFEKICIFLLSWSLACVSYDKYDAMKYVYPGMGFPQFVAVTRTLLRGTASDIKDKIVGVLLSLIPLQVRKPIYEYCQEKPRWISEKSSEFMSFGLLGWLVGPVQRIVVSVPQADGTTEEWLSGVKLTECRYLVESGCKSACLHLCKGPTQSFFNDHLGLKVHMKPDFKDCSCEMLFGIAAPAPEVDPAYGEPCFSTCSMAKMKFSNKKKNKENVSEEQASGFNKCS